MYYNLFALNLHWVFAMNESLIEEMTKIIVDAVHPQQIILFGSHAHEEASSESDYDFMIIQDSKSSPELNGR